MTSLAVDLELVRKYSVPGPRYTSYPPAPQFSENVSWQEVLVAIGETNAGTAPLSLYVHLPFCQSLCWFCGCTTVITQNQGVSARYLDYLKREFALAMPNLSKSRQVVQIHLGGGTPNFLLPSELAKLGELLHSSFSISSQVEAGVEIDPRVTSREQVKVLKSIGFTRASLGVQDHNSEVQKAIHRIQPRECTEASVQMLREEGFISINIDLIYGLPHQTVSSFEETLNDVLALNPDRFAVFSYAHVPWLKKTQNVLNDLLPTPEIKLALLKLTIERLTAAGYVYIGMDHFAKESDELAQAQRLSTLQRNFQGYSTHGDADIFGFGMSSISQAGRAYWQNQRELKQYYRALDADRLPYLRGYLLSTDDIIRRATIMQIMCNLHLDFNYLQLHFGIEASSYFAAELIKLQPLVADGLLTVNAAGIKISDMGRLFIRNIAMCFDRYLPKEGEKKIFSKTV